MLKAVAGSVPYRVAVCVIGSREARRSHPQQRSCEHCHLVMFTYLSTFCKNWTRLALEYIVPYLGLFVQDACLFLSFSSRIKCLQRVHLSISLHDLPSLALHVLPFIHSWYRETHETNVCRLSAATR
jgi:hypothetical protein